MKILTLILPLAASIAATQAQVIIYSLSFSTTGPSVNYEALDSGYVVIDSNGGSFSSIIILKNPDNNRRFYTTSLLAGSYYDLLEDGTGDIYGVMTSSGSSSGNSTLESLMMQTIGPASQTSVGGGSSLQIPRRMRGFLLGNSEEATSVDTRGRPQVEFGFAGFSRVTARFDSTSTRDANNARLSASATITAITKTLERRGIRPEPTPSPSPTPTPTPSP